MFTPRGLVIGGRICATWFARMLSSRESLLLFFGMPPFDVECTSSFEAHFFSTYLKQPKQVKQMESPTVTSKK